MATLQPATNPPFPLNTAQQQAVHAPNGPLLVLAGAGTGKTRVVIARIGELIRRGTRPSRILAVTFTNKAAREMLARASAAGGRRRDPEEKPEISTIHALCARILRRHAEAAGYPRRFAIIDRGEQEGIARRVLRELRVPETSLRPGDLLARISRWKTAAVRPAEAIETAGEDSWHLAASGYRRYQEALRATGAVDFDDLLCVVDELFTREPEIRRAEAGRFDHVLVDEYQDTSRTQERILSDLARDHRSFCVVGDDDQSIYGWRGAEISHILEFPRRWPGASVVRLEENYRSTPQIIAAANLLISRNTHRHGKQLLATSAEGPPPVILQAGDEEEEAKRVVGEVADRIRLGEVAPGEAVILVRTGEQTRLFEQDLRRRGVPYELVGSRSFFDRREVKDVMAYLRLLVDPDDDMALLRIANVPPRGLSSAAIRKTREAAGLAGRSLWSELLAARDEGRLSSAAAGGVERLAEWAGGNFTGQRPSQLLTRLIDSVGYERFLEQEYDDADDRAARIACVGELVSGLARAERGREGTPFAEIVRGFLDELVLEVRESERLQDDRPRGDVLRLMTLHAAKGLEFDAVWMVGLEEGYLPHRRSIGDSEAAIAEERRLCYVGVTRAKKRLTLSLCLSRTKWGKKRPCQPSRFLYELTGQAEKFVEQPDPPPGRQPAPRSRRSPRRPRSAK
jgi:DNA helicase II / ATP-dependent DNA helicase PcrA